MVPDEKPEPVILVTGGAGYIGSQLIRDLAQDAEFAGYTIRIYDSLRRQHMCGVMDLPQNRRFEFVEGDVLDRFNLERAMAGVTAVVHLAAIVSTPLSFDHPEWTRQVNHWGTANVVDCALSLGIRRLIYASSVSVYGPGGPFRESDTCHPIGPYAISKCKGEEEVLQGGLRGLEYTIVRLATVFGHSPAIRFDAVANRFACMVSLKRSMVIHGNGHQIRPLIHVRDASAVLRMCLSDPRLKKEILNAVTVNPSIRDIADTLRSLVPTASARYTEQDIMTKISYEIDSSKLGFLGFSPTYSLEEGMSEILAHLQGFSRAMLGAHNLREWPD